MITISKRWLIVLSAVILATVLAAVGLLESNGHSLFAYSPPTVTSPVSTAQIDLSFSGSGSTNALTIGASDMVAGDTMAREVVLTNSGNVPIGNITLSVSASPSTDLTTETGGLSLEAQTCSTNWTATSLPDGGYSYSCGGTTTTLFNEPIASLPSTEQLISSPLAVNTSQPVVFTVALPSSAGNTFEDLSTTLNFAFTAVQKPGGAV